MTLYISNTDETFSQQSGKFVIGGYLGMESKWPAFSMQWHKFILSPPPTIPHLHMTDIRSGAWREKHNICRKQAEEKVLAACSLIVSHDIEPYLSQISHRAYQRSKEAIHHAGIKTKPHHNEIDYVCFIAYILNVLHDLPTRHPDVTKINFIVDRKNYVSSYLARDVHDEMESLLPEMNPKLTGLFGDIIPISMENHMPLQAADVFCWHLQRDLRENEEPEVLACQRILQNQEITPVNISDPVIEKLTDAFIKAARRG